MKCGQRKMEQIEVHRMLAVYAETTLSTVAIGEMFNRDHSTVHYHIVKNKVRRGMIFTTRHLHIEQEMPPAYIPTPKAPKEPVKNYAYYIEQEQKRKLAQSHSKSFPTDLLIKIKKVKVPSDTIELGGGIIV